MSAKVDIQIITIIQQIHHWIGHTVRHKSLLPDIIDGQMKGRPKGGSRRMQMLHMLAKDGYLAPKQEAEDRWRWTR